MSTCLHIHVLFLYIFSLYMQARHIKETGKSLAWRGWKIHFCWVNQVLYALINLNMCLLTCLGAAQTRKWDMTLGFLYWRYGICTSVYLTAMNMLVSHDRWLSALFLIRIQHTTRYTHHIKHIQYPVCWVPTFSPISQREMSRICYEMLFEIISGQIPWVYIAVCIILCLYCMLKIC